VAALTKAAECSTCGRPIRPRCPGCGQAERPKWTPAIGGSPASFARLAQAGFDARPNDVEGSFAWTQKKAREAAAAKRAAKK